MEGAGASWARARGGGAPDPCGSADERRARAARRALSRPEERRHAGEARERFGRVVVEPVRVVALADVGSAKTLVRLPFRAEDAQRDAESLDAAERGGIVEVEGVLAYAAEHHLDATPRSADAICLL